MHGSRIALQSSIRYYMWLGFTLFDFLSLFIDSASELSAPDGIHGLGCLVLLLMAIDMVGSLYSLESLLMSCTAPSTCRSAGLVGCRWVEASLFRRSVMTISMCV